MGTAAVQAALRTGAVPIATTRGEAKRQRLLELGAAHVITRDSEDLVKEVKLRAARPCSTAAPSPLSRGSGPLVRVEWLWSAQRGRCVIFRCFKGR
ncbi:zinc-binding dehydrogenase [Streptomyces inhibens]|uniref:zinc-binding dehydrogenase n=1 Tax=Streptomyces inhibens TaxID=2293571 RepID=UPI0036A690FD